MNKIIVCNDDGVDAIGIDYLAKALMAYGEVVVYAPYKEHSATSHSAHFVDPIKVEEIKDRPYRCFKVYGTPADSARIGLALEPDTNLVVSGINNGCNIGIDMHYSGTIGAAMEALAHGISAFAFSMAYNNIEPFIPYLDDAIKKAFKLSEYYNGKIFLLNINFPYQLPVKGYKLTRQGFFENNIEMIIKDGGYIEKCYNQYYDLTDKTIDYTNLKDGYISITPLTFDMTDYQMLEILKEKEDI